MLLEVTEAATEEPLGTVLIAHGFAEHHGRYGALKKALNEAGYDAWCADFTGHGTSKGARARVDVGTLIGEHLVARKELLAACRSDRIFLFGHSMGGLITLASTLLSPTHIQAVAVTGPAVRPLPKTPLPVAKLGASVARRLPFLDSINLDDTLISRDPAVVQAYRDDPLVHHGKVPLLTGTTMVLQGEQVIRNANILAKPVLIMHGSADGLASVEGSLEFARAAGDLATVEVVEGAFHELLNEPESSTYESRIIDWFNQW